MFILLLSVLVTLFTTIITTKTTANDMTVTKAVIYTYSIPPAGSRNHHYH